MKLGLLTLLLLVAPVWAQPSAYTSSDGRFTVTFPAPYRPALGDQVNLFKDGVNYSVAATEMPESDEAMLAAFRRVEGRKPGTQVTAVQCGKVQGLESNGPGRLQRVFVVNKVMYSLNVRYSGSQPPAEARAFLDSFRFSSQVRPTAQNTDSGAKRADPGASHGYLLLCGANLKNIQVGAEMYASDHQGKYPASLQQLVGPDYLKTIPTCQGSAYSYSVTGKTIRLICTNPQHRSAGIPSGYPRIEADQCLMGPGTPLR
ncbi:MAG: hypothetical protein U0931_31275 [Vulcanimicrobiota bacterium]